MRTTKPFWKAAVSTSLWIVTLVDSGIQLFAGAKFLQGFTILLLSVILGHIALKYLEKVFCTKPC